MKVWKMRRIRFKKGPWTQWNSIENLNWQCYSFSKSQLLSRIKASLGQQHQSLLTMFFSFQTHQYQLHDAICQDFRRLDLSAKLSPQLNFLTLKIQLLSKEWILEFYSQLGNIFYDHTSLAILASVDTSFKVIIIGKFWRQ